MQILQLTLHIQKISEMIISIKLRESKKVI